ncbi:hypothetical protein C8J31_11465 [Rhizobium sp. PP-CC-2G-626]|nr:hypothetical protein C8J31_11465 [Rhizobium sp. PP-CC-2G-626]
MPLQQVHTPRHNSLHFAVAVRAHVYSSASARSYLPSKHLCSEMPGIMDFSKYLDWYMAVLWQKEDTRNMGVR